MDQGTYDAALAARKNKPEWPSPIEAAAYLTAKGFRETKPGVWSQPGDGHILTGKQSKCLSVLNGKTSRALGMSAEAGRHGS